MINVFELEKKINDNFFILKFFELEELFLIQVFPFRMWLLKDYDPLTDDVDVNEYCNNDYVDTGCLTPLFILTNHCNLACEYCYADEGSYGCEGDFMPLEVIESTFAGLFELYKNSIKANKPSSFDVNAVCFGGEPLLHLKGLQKVFECQTKIANELRDIFPETKISVKQHINSNGYAISPETEEYLSANKQFIEMVFSFDGINHDKHRLTKDGRTTAIEALNSIIHYSQIGIDTSVTCCIHPDELDRFRENIDYIFNVVPQNVSVNFSFLRGSLHFRDASKKNSIYSYDENAVKACAEIIAEYIRKGYNIYNKKFSNLQERAYKYRCPAIGKKEFCIMPNGYVYPCHNFVDKKYSYGKTSDCKTYTMHNDVFDKQIENRTIFDTKGCTDCCMKSICISNFDCPSHSLFDFGDIHLNDSCICAFGRIVQKELFLNAVHDMLL